jgi:hypothetical protein
MNRFYCDITKQAYLQHSIIWGYRRRIFYFVRLAPVTRKIRKTDRILKGWWITVDVRMYWKVYHHRNATVTRQRSLWAVYISIHLNFVFHLPVECRLFNMSMIVSLQSDWCAVLIVVSSRSNTTQSITRNADLFPY